MRRWLLRLLLLAGIAAIILFVRRRSSAAKAPAAPAWPPFDNAERRSRVASPGISSIPEDVPPSQRWSDPVDKACPAGFDVKVKLASGIYHLPGMFAYERTIPDRCYASPDAAEADGFRAAKR
jgi:hypothetical protein